MLRLQEMVADSNWDVYGSGQCGPGAGASNTINTVGECRVKGRTDNCIGTDGLKFTHSFIQMQNMELKTNLQILHFLKMTLSPKTPVSSHYVL